MPESTKKLFKYIRLGDQNEKVEIQAEAAGAAGNVTVAATLTATHAADALDIASIFAMFAKDFLKQFLEQTGRLFMFPLAAIASVVESLLYWVLVYRNKAKDKGLLATAIVSTLGTVAIAFAVIASFAAAAIFGAIAPMIFTGVLGFKTFFNLGMAGFYAGKASLSHGVERTNYKQKAISHGVAFLACALLTTAVAVVMVAAKEALWFIGTAGGIVSLGGGIIRGAMLAYNKYQAKKVAAAAATKDSKESHDDKVAPTVSSTSVPVVSSKPNGEEMNLSLTKENDGKKERKPSEAELLFLFNNTNFENKLNIAATIPNTEKNKPVKVKAKVNKIYQIGVFKNDAGKKTLGSRPIKIKVPEVKVKGPTETKRNFKIDNYKVGKWVKEFPHSEKTKKNKFNIEAADTANKLRRSSSFDQLNSIEQPRSPEQTNLLKFK